MSMFQELNALQNQMNRMMQQHFPGVGRGFGQGFPSTLGGGFWDEDIVDMPTLMNLNRPSWGESSWGANIPQLRGKTEESKEDVNVGGRGTQLATKEHTGGTGLQTFKPTQFIRAPVNIEEQKDKYIVTCDMPGFDKQNIKVNIGDDGLLHMKGEQTQEWVDQSKDKKYLRAERTFANVQRSVRLPRGVNSDQISANYCNGVLHVNLAKTEESQKQKHDIQIQ